MEHPPNTEECENIREQRSEQRSATEHPPNKKDPDIRLQKYSNPSHVRTKTYNNRKPDIGLGILIFMPSHEADDIIRYYGKYLGHGQSKTAFVLQCPGAEFHGNVLKVAKTTDMEPSVFTRAFKHKLTTSILYNCHGAFFCIEYILFFEKVSTHSSSLHPNPLTSSHRLMYMHQLTIRYIGHICHIYHIYDICHLCYIMTRTTVISSL